MIRHSEVERTEQGKRNHSRSRVLKEMDEGFMNEAREPEV